MANKPEDSIEKPLSFKILINGKNVSDKYKIIKLNVDKAVNKISRAKVYISGGNAYLNTFDESENSDFEPGNSVEFSFGYEQKNKAVFKGIVEKIGISLKNGYASKPWQSLLVLDCVDKAIKLTNSYTSDVFEKKKDSDIFSSLINKISGLKATVTATAFIHPFLPKYNSNDWDFILNRAKHNGLLVVNSDNSIHIAKPSKAISKTETEITNGLSTINFDAQIDAGTQITSVNLDSWDSFTEKSVKSKAVEPSLISNNTLSGKKISISTSPNEVHINMPQGVDASELKEISNAYLLNSRLKRIYGNAKFKGLTDIGVGSLAVLKGFGKPFDGKIYITGISHQIESGIFTTAIEFGLKNSILHKKKIDKSQIVDPIEGLQIGTVKKIDSDPLNQDRIQVLIPSLKDTGLGIWAKLSQFYTSSKAGALFVPEVGTQVIVSFIANDPRKPVILGSLYTKKEVAYSKITKENSKKAIVSKSKLKLEFDDKDKIITISTPNKNSIVISEKEKEITITDENKNIFKMSKSGIEINSTKDIKMIASGAVSIEGSKGVIIKGKSGKGVDVSGNKVGIVSKTSLTAKGGSKTDVIASGKVTIKGATVGIN